MSTTNPWVVAKETGEVRGLLAELNSNPSQKKASEDVRENMQCVKNMYEKNNIRLLCSTLYSSLCCALCYCSTIVSKNYIFLIFKNNL